MIILSFTCSFILNRNPLAQELRLRFLEYAKVRPGNLKDRLVIMMEC